MSKALKNPKEEAFCQYYTTIRKKGEAAKQAGYSEKSASSQAYQLLQKTTIQNRIAEIEAENSEHWIVDKNWLLGELVGTYRKCSKPEEVLIWNDEAKAMRPSGEYKFDSRGALGALDMIGKHIGFFEKDNSQNKSDNKIELTIKGSKSNLMDQVIEQENNSLAKLRCR